MSDLPYGVVMHGDTPMIQYNNPGSDNPDEMMFTPYSPSSYAKLYPGYEDTLDPDYIAAQQQAANDTPRQPFEDNQMQKDTYDALMAIKNEDMTAEGTKNLNPVLANLFEQASRSSGDLSIPYSGPQQVDMQSLIPDPVQGRMGKVLSANMRENMLDNRSLFDGVNAGSIFNDMKKSINTDMDSLGTRASSILSLFG